MPRGHCNSHAPTMGFVVRRKRLLTRLAIGVVIVALLAMSNLWWSLWQVSGAQGTFSMARALPACSGQTLLEGFTYHFHDPHRGEIVTFHARGAIGSEITPDPDSHELEINKRVIGIPGDTVVGRDNRVYVNGRKADDIATQPFPSVHLGSKEYFVMGDNRSASHDSRDFGSVPRAAIYARAVFIVWPVARVGVPRYDKSQVPPGPLCGAG
jgi:signal peptidase I